MKNLFVTLMSMGILAGSANSADMGVTVSIGQPGFYGRLDFGTPPPQPPQVIYTRPIVVHTPPPGIVYAPLYLRVPPSEARDWRRHCHHYRACGHPVYFVQDNWYQNVYVPHYHRHHGDQGHPGRGYAKGHRDRDR